MIAVTYKQTTKNCSITIRQASVQGKSLGSGQRFDSKEEENEHVKIYHTKSKKVQCDLGVFQTSIRTFFNDNKVSKKILVVVRVLKI